MKSRVIKVKGDSPTLKSGAFAQDQAGAASLSSTLPFAQLEIQRLREGPSFPGITQQLGAELGTAAASRPSESNCHYLPRVPKVVRPEWGNRRVGMKYSGGLGYIFGGKINLGVGERYCQSWKLWSKPFSQGD